jgi:hypothetical protein
MVIDLDSRTSTPSQGSENHREHGNRKAVENNKRIEAA